MAVFYVLTTRCATRRSYTTPVDSTPVTMDLDLWSPPMAAAPAAPSCRPVHRSLRTARSITEWPASTLCLGTDGLRDRARVDSTFAGAAHAARHLIKETR
jgi:hypothetical protein